MSASPENFFDMEDPINDAERLAKILNLLLGIMASGEKVTCANLEGYAGCTEAYVLHQLAERLEQVTDAALKHYKGCYPAVSRALQGAPASPAA